MIDHVQKPPAYGPTLPECVGNPVGPESAGNRHCREIRVPSVAGIFRHDAALGARIVGRRFRGLGRLLLEDPPNGRLADVDTCPGQRVSNLYFAERRAE